MSSATNSVERKSDIDEIKDAMDDYLRKSSEYMQANTQNEIAAVLQPSLSVSELQIHSETTAISGPSKSKNKSFYQFVLIAIMIGSLSILLSLVFHFFDLKRQISHHEAYYKYLHKAIEIKKEQPKETILSVCYTAIHHMDIVSIYKSRNVRLAHLKADIEQLQNRQHNNHTKGESNKKQELIIMCDVELQLMFNAIKQDQNEYKRISQIQQLSKAHQEAYFQFLKKAIQFQQENPAKNIITSCNAAIHDVDVVSIYSSAIDDIANMKSDVEELKQITQHKATKTLNKKQQLILICEKELTLRTKANDEDIQQTHQRNADAKSEAVQIV